MVKIWGEAFWKDSPRPTGPLRHRPAQLVPVAALGLITILIGLFPGPLFELANEAARQLLASNPAYVPASR